MSVSRVRTRDKTLTDPVRTNPVDKYLLHWQRVVFFALVVIVVVGLAVTLID